LCFGPSFSQVNNSYSVSAGYADYSTCPTPYNNVGASYTDNTCSATNAPHLGNYSYYTDSTGNACVLGCTYTSDDVVFITALEVSSGKWRTNGNGWTSNGQVCSADNTVSKQTYDPTKPSCKAVGTSKASFCVQPGKECVVFADGTSQCWTPWALNPDTTPRTNKDGTQGAGISTTQGVSAPAPPNMANATKVGDQNFQDGSNKGTMTLYSGSGLNNEASQSGTASQGTANGTGGAADGSNNGSGNNKGDGGKCDGTGDCTNSGGAGAGVGKVYTKTGKTMSSVWGDFRVAASNAPIITASRNFFTVNVSGNCPAFSMPATRYTAAMTFDAHCREPLASVLYYGGFILLAGFCYVGWKVAVG
jgi:hypothetical protein